MTQFIIVRHGQSLANEMGLFGGSGNFPLTEKGIAQANATAQELDKYKIDVVYASDLQRAFKTGEVIAKRQNCPIIKEKALRELCGGLWESCIFDQIGSDFPKEYELWKTDLINCTPPEGEAFTHLFERVSACLARLAKENDGKTVCIAAHATPIRAMEAFFAGGIEHTYDFNWVSNSSITIVNYENGIWTKILRSFDEHLGNMSTRLPSSI